MSTIASTGLSAAGLKAEFLERFGATPTIFQDFSTRLASNTEKESYGWLGSVPPLREMGQGRLARGMFAEKYDIENLTYELTLAIKRNEIADDQVGAIRMRIGELAARAAQHKDSEIARLLINGGASGFNAYDGKTFFATDHESGKSGAQSNDITFDCSSHTAPTVAEIRAAISKSITQLLKLKDDQGEPKNESATGLTVVTPPDLYMLAIEALGATVISNTSTNNALVSAARVLGFARLTDATKFYLLKNDVPVRPFVFQDREPIEFGAQEQESESGFMREVYLYGVRARYRMTYGYWQHAVRCALN